jgi:hypothetical protein
MDRFPPGLDRFDYTVVHDGAWTFGLEELLLLLLLLTVVALGAIWLARLRREGRGEGAPETGPPAASPTPAAAAPIRPGTDPALDELRLRYARGDVSSDDYRRAFDDLTGAPTPWPQPPPGEQPTAS